MIDIINTAAQYGIIPCIMLVVLYLIDKHNKNKANERDKELDIEKETSLISSIESIIKAARDVEHTPEDEDSKTRLNNYIANQLGCLIEKGANRAYLFSYHNGAKDLLGKGYTKMSIILEQVDMTCQSIMKEFQNVPRAMFPILYKTLSKNDLYIIPDVKQLEEQDPMTYQFFSMHNVKSAIFHAIRASNGLMLGFIGIEYVNEACIDIDSAKKDLQKKAQRITGALVTHNEYSKD